MRYLSIYGSEGFRTFNGVLNGKLPYTPEKIPMIDPEIVIERDFVLRLTEVVSPYTGNHPKLKDILPIIPSHIGSLHSISDRCSLWRPKNHLSLLGELLLAGLFENFLPEEMNKQLYFFAQSEDIGLAFQEAFSLENKTILFPENSSFRTPLSNEKTKIFSFDSSNKNLKNILLGKQPLYCDAHNIFRIVGHIATMIHALFVTEEKRQRFYNDLVSLVIPADNMEYVLAAYYLSKSKFPIKNIYAVSTNHRMVHNFIERGEFKITDIKSYEQLEISLDRFLFEAARASSEKVMFWKKELMQKGSFKVDSKTLSSLQLKFKSLFATKTYYDTVLEDFQEKTELQETKIALMGYKLSQELTEHTLIFDEIDPLVQGISQELTPIPKKEFS